MRGAYYNEIDPFCAQWIRNLIEAGHTAPGDVDERSILDVRARDLAGYTQAHFFAGIAVWSFALRQAGWDDARPVWTGSCPCQPFSAAGRRGGASDERHLWPHWHHLIAECRPAVVLGEQVASKDGLAWLDLVQADMEGSGYAIGAADLCAAGVGALHVRQRLWFVADAERPGRAGLEPDGHGVSRVVQAEELQYRRAGLPARLHPRSDRAAVRPVDGSARCVDAVRAYGNAINAEAAAAFIRSVMDCIP